MQESAPGPFRVEHIREGSRYELRDGHPVYCMPTGGRGGGANLVGGQALGTDPSVEIAGVDVGFTPDPTNLRAPDIAVGGFKNEPGFAKGAPPLAVEYADTGQDEAELKAKISELLEAGTKYVWVVRLVGSRRVEIHEKGQKMRLAMPGDTLLAPGILKNPVRVEALYDREAAHEATLTNLLQRRGYESLDAVRDEGKIANARTSVLAVLKARGLSVSEEERAHILASQDPDELARWLTRAATADSTKAVLSTRKPRRR